MTTQQDNPDQRLERYLDDLMTPEERSAFEAELDQHPEWQSEIELQRQIDDRLNALFEPGKPVPVPAEATPTSLRFPGGRQGKIGAVAAIIALGLAIALWANSGPSIRMGRPMASSPFSAYVDMTSGDYKPAYICRDNEQFREVTRTRYGAALQVDPEVPDAGILGWNYDYQVLSTRTATILADVDGTRILLFMDHRDLDRSIEPEDTDLHLFRKQVGPIVVYEVTPLGKPSLLCKLDRGK